MIDIRKTLEKAHESLQNANIEHALIGGLALATLGINRATADVDFLIDGIDKEKAKKVLINSGFKLKFETKEVLQFEGIGFLDILLANRPLSKEMLKAAKIFPEINIKCLGPEDIIGLKIQAYKNNPKREFQDKADIQSLIEKHENLNWNKIKQYADLFDEWEVVEGIRSK